MGQFLFIILCVTLGYVAYKHAGAVRSAGSALCRKNCDECTRKCWIMKKTEEMMRMLYGLLHKKNKDTRNPYGMKDFGCFFLV